MNSDVGLMLTMVSLELLLGSRGNLPIYLLLYKLFPELSVAMPRKWISVFI